MKIRNYIILCLVAFLAIVSCKEERNPYQLIPLNERNQLDDEAIVIYLKENGFDSKGKIQSLSYLPNGTTSLYELAHKDETGFWYVINPEVPANGESITNEGSSSALLQYNLFSFVPEKYENEKAEKKYDLKVNPTMVKTTINTTGVPEWDPSFYYKETSPELYEIPGIINGLKYFKATDRDENALPAVHFQGVIIVPSRLAFARKSNQLVNGYDQSFILNFELYKVKPR